MKERERNPSQRKERLRNKSAKWKGSFPSETSTIPTFGPAHMLDGAD